MTFIDVQMCICVSKRLYWYVDATLLFFHIDTGQSYSFLSINLLLLTNVRRRSSQFNLVVNLTVSRSVSESVSQSILKSVSWVDNQCINQEVT